MDFEQTPDLSRLNATVKVSDMIFNLRSSFHLADFNKVAEILVCREKTMSEEIGHWKRAYELMEKKHGEAVLGRLFVDDELSKCKRQLGELEDQVARLEEDKQLDQEKEILVAREKQMNEEIGQLKSESVLMEKKLGDEMKGRLSIEEDLSKCKRELGELTNHVGRLEEDKRVDLDKIKVSLEREKRAQDMYTELLEDFERVKRENRDLVVKNTESESARVKAERELESVKKKNVEFDLRVTRLEGQVELMISQRREQFKSKNLSEPHVKEVICNGKEKGSSSEGADCVDNRFNRREAGACFVIHPCNGGISIPRQTGGEGEVSSEREDSLRKKHQKTDNSERNIESAVVVEITDSGENMPIQNRPNVDTTDVPNFTPMEEETKNMVSGRTSGSKRNLSSFLDVSGRANGCDNGSVMNWSSSTSDSDTDSDSDSDSDSDGDSCDSVAINRIISQGKSRRG